MQNNNSDFLKLKTNNKNKMNNNSKIILDKLICIKMRYNMT